MTAREIAEWLSEDKDKCELIRLRIKEYAIQKCKEQRDICSKEAKNISNGIIPSDLRNAPEPEFD